LYKVFGVNVLAAIVAETLVLDPPVAEEGVVATFDP
jgi:hypothetical protein